MIKGKAKKLTKKKISNRRNPSYAIRNINVIDLSNLIKNNKFLEDEIMEIIEDLDITYGDSNVDATLINSKLFNRIIDDLPKNTFINIEV